MMMMMAIQGKRRREEMRRGRTLQKVNGIILLKIIRYHYYETHFFDRQRYISKYTHTRRRKGLLTVQFLSFFARQVWCQIVRSSLLHSIPYIFLFSLKTFPNFCCTASPYFIEFPRRILPPFNLRAIVSYATY
jgi:hypothetical protein